MAKLSRAHLKRALTSRRRSAEAGRRRDQELARRRVEVAGLRRRVVRLSKRVRKLERALDRRVGELEEGLQEQRALGYRVASLGDLVAEVIAASASGDRAELEAALDKYAREV